MLGAVCDSVLSHLGSSHGLAVAKFVNYEELSARSNLPTTLMLSQRFLVAAGASRTDWVSFGSFSASHVALVLAPGAVNRDWKLQKALDGLSIRDAGLVGTSLEMWGIGVALELSEFASLDELFGAVDDALIEAEGSPRSANRTDTWCSS